MSTRHSLALLSLLGLACGGATASPTSSDASTSDAAAPTCHDVSLQSPLQTHFVLNDLPPAIQPTEPPPPPGTYGLVTVTDYVGASGAAGYLGMTVRIDGDGTWNEIVASGDGEPSSHLHEVVTRRTFILVPARAGDEYEAFVQCGPKSSEATMRFWRLPDGRWFVLTQIGEFPRTLVLEAQ